LTKREQILNTSLQLFAEQGAQSTPMSQIVAESGVATGTIYHHFKSKQEIIEALYLSFKKGLGQLFESAFKQADSTKVQFENIWRAVFDFYVQEPLKYRFSQQVLHSHYIDEAVRQEGLSYYQAFCDFFEAGMDEGEFAKMELHLAMELIHNSICTVADLFLEENIEHLELRAAEAIQYAWRGIVAPKQKENE
jgi:AcrR family transcriptional regulator